MFKSLKTSLPHEVDPYNAAALHLKLYFGMYPLYEDEYAVDPLTGKLPGNLHNSYLVSRPGKEDLGADLLMFAGIAVKYVGNSLGLLGLRCFQLLRSSTERTFMNYNSVLHTWKNRTWQNARNIEGEKFDSYVLKIVPHNVMVKRLQAVENIHKALQSISSIYDASVATSSDDFLTPECKKAISAMDSIGFASTDFDVAKDTVAEYKNMRVKQSLYLHKYTLKNILTVIDRFNKIAKYTDPTYVDALEAKYNVCTDKLESYELTTDTTETFSDKDVEDRDHVAKIKAARLWWYTHFVKAAYTVTNDIFSDIEKLTLATERCIATSNE